MHSEPRGQQNTRKFENVLRKSITKYEYDFRLNEQICGIHKGIEIIRIAYE